MAELAEWIAGSGAHLNSTHGTNGFVTAVDALGARSTHNRYRVLGRTAYTRQLATQRGGHTTISATHMKLTQWNPFDEDFFELPVALRRLVNDVPIDLYEENGALIAKAVFPKAVAESARVTVSETLLTIAGAHEQESEAHERNYFTKEIRRGAFSRSVRLPKAVDASKVTAQYEHGELVITLPTLEGAGHGAATIPVRIA